MATNAVEKERLQAQIKAQGEVVRKLKQEKRSQEEVRELLKFVCVVFTVGYRCVMICPRHKPLLPGMAVLLLRRCWSPLTQMRVTDLLVDVL